MSLEGCSEVHPRKIAVPVDNARQELLLEKVGPIPNMTTKNVREMRNISITSSALYG